MSSYLNFYLVPKKKENNEEEQKPLLFTSYSRNSGVYQAYREKVNPEYIGNDEEYHYTELTKEKAQYTVDDTKESLQTLKLRLDNRISAYREMPNLNKEVADDFIEDYVSTREYSRELEDTIKELQFIANLVSDISNDYTDFEKVLINID